MILEAVKGGTEKFMKNPWFRKIWCPSEDSALLSWPEEWFKNKKSKKPKISSAIALNASQRRAVKTMLSTDSDFLTIVQGPPGTGKTSVIACFVQSAIDAGRNGIWLIAETNVAVKNIAEKLASVNFTAWRLLVSKDFHFDWYSLSLRNLFSKSWFLGMSISIPKFETILYVPRNLRGFRYVVWMDVKSCSAH